jgi:hypothetical protein
MCVVMLLSATSMVLILSQLPCALHWFKHDKANSGALWSKIWRDHRDRLMHCSGRSALELGTGDSFSDAHSWRVVGLGCSNGRRSTCTIMRNVVLESNIELVAAFDHSNWQLRLLLAFSTKFGLIVKSYLVQGAAVVKHL